MVSGCSEATISSDLESSTGAASSPGTGCADTSAAAARSGVAESEHPASSRLTVVAALTARTDARFTSPNLPIARKEGVLWMDLMY